MDDRQVEDLLRATWSPKPPEDLKRRALGGSEPVTQPRSRPISRIVFRLGWAMASVAAAACLLLILARTIGFSNHVSHARAIRHTLTASTPPGLGNADGVETQRRGERRVVVRPLRHRTRIVSAIRHHAAPQGSPSVTYVDAKAFEEASRKSVEQSEQAASSQPSVNQAQIWSSGNARLVEDWVLLPSGDYKPLAEAQNIMDGRLDPREPRDAVHREG